MIINGTELVGVMPGKDFIDTLLAPRERKPYISNESRLEDGVRVIITTPRFASRSITLEFQITGKTTSEFEQNKAALYSALRSTVITLSVPEVSSDVYHLIYTGKSSTYAWSRSGCSCKIKVGFDEPNPGNRVN